MTLRSGRVLQDSTVASKNGATTIKSLSLLDVETEENITMNDMGNADLSVNPGLNMLMVTEPFAERVSLSPMDVIIRSDQTEVALHATTPKGVTTPGAATWINSKVIIEGKTLTYDYVNQPMDVKGYTNHAHIQDNPRHLFAEATGWFFGT